MPTFGHLKRDFPRLEPLRGYDPNEPQTQTAAYRVKAGEIILSGMVISPVWNSSDSVYEWQQGVGTSLDVPVYFALQDSEDADVVEAGNLVGLSCAGQFEIEIAFFKEDDTYNEGTLLTVGLTTDDWTLTAGKAAAAPKEGGATRSATTNNGSGYVKALAAGGTSVIVGQVTRAASSGSAGTVNSLNGINSNVVYKDVIAFRTMYRPRSA